MADSEAAEKLGAGLAADVAHAVRGPYAAALPALGMLLDGALGGLTPVQREALDTVERSVRRAFADARDLATLLTGELDRHELRPAPCTVDELFAAALGMAALDTTVAVRLTVAPGLPAVLVDRERTAAVVAVLVRRRLGFPGEEPAALELCAVLETPATVQVRISAGPLAEGLKVDLGAADNGARGAALLACRALIDAQGGRLRIGGGDGEATRPRDPGSSNAVPPVGSTLSLPTVPE